MEAYLWTVEYDVQKGIRFTRKKHVVTDVPEPESAISIFRSGCEDDVDFVRSVEFEREIIR